MNDARRVSSFETERHLGAQVHDFFFRQWTGGYLVIKRDSRN